MTLEEAFNKCELDKWSHYVILSKKYLGENAFLIKSRYTIQSSPLIKGKVDANKGTRLVIMVYDGNNNFREIGIPFKLPKDSPEWSAGIFKGDLSVPLLEDADYNYKEEPIKLLELINAYNTNEAIRNIYPKVEANDFFY